MKQQIILVVDALPEVANKEGLQKLMQFLESAQLPQVKSAYTGDKLLAARSHLDALAEAAPYKGMYDFTFYYEGGNLESGISVYSRLFRFGLALNCEPEESDFFIRMIIRICEAFPIAWAYVCPLSGMTPLYSLYSQFPRTFHFNGLHWLQYWGREEAAAQGGLQKLLATPGIQARPLGEGILIQVGDNPHEMITEEGMKRLVDATRALPEVNK